jgi:hypothetical protein
MDGISETEREAKRDQPSPLMAEVEDRLRAIGKGGAEPWNAPIEERRATRRRDMEILRLAAMESALHTTEYIAGRLPSWKLAAFEHVRDPLASLANLNRSIIQITLAEDRFDETSEERAARIVAEAEAKAKAEQAAEAERTYSADQLRRAENKRRVQGSVRAITLSSLKLPYYDREKLLAGLFAELEADDAYGRDPAETVADICVRFGIGPETEGLDPTELLARKAELVTLARAHIEALRGPQTPDRGDRCASTATDAPSAPPAQAQGPPD